MGDIAELWIWMLGIALISFAPLGIFIYRFTTKAGDPLGNQGPVHLPDPKIEALVDGILGRIFEKLPRFAPTGMKKSSAAQAPAAHAAAAPAAPAATQQAVEQAAEKPEAAVQPAAKAEAKPAAKPAAAKPAAKRSRKPAAKPKE